MKRRQNSVGVARAEKRLVGSLVRALKRNTGSSRRIVLSSEVDCFQGVADVVRGVASGHALVSDAKPHDLLKFSFSTAKVLAALAGKKETTKERLVQETGLTRNTIARQLLVLRRSDLIDDIKNDRIVVTRKVEHPFREMIAFEVKVKDWGTGIYQARNYRSFAHEVFLALPLERAKRLGSRTQLFRRLKVGLVGIGKRGELIWLIKSPRRKPVSPGRSFLAAFHLMRDSCRSTARSAPHSRSRQVRRANY
jgi:hypothetical protein